MHMPPLAFWNPAKNLVGHGVILAEHASSLLSQQIEEPEDVNIVNHWDASSAIYYITDQSAVCIIDESAIDLVASNNGGALIAVCKDSESADLGH